MHLGPSSPSRFSAGTFTSANESSAVATDATAVRIMVDEFIRLHLDEKLAAEQAAMAMVGHRDTGQRGWTEVSSCTVTTATCANIQWLIVSGFTGAKPPYSNPPYSTGLGSAWDKCCRAAAGQALVIVVEGVRS
jgi:hypothetical protein